MHHPFEKLFDDALRKSTDGENLIADVAFDLKGKGYQPSEIYLALRHFEHGLIQDRDIALAKAALEELAPFAEDAKEEVE